MMVSEKSIMERAPLSDFDLQAYLDSELDWERAKNVLAYIESNPSARQRYEELQKQKLMLREWWKQQKQN